MAPLTWRNVDAPNNSNVAAMLDAAARSFEGGFSGVGKALSGFRDNQVQRASAGALSELAKIQGGADVASTLGRIDQMVRPEDRSAELAKAMLDITGTALGYDSRRASTNATNSINARAQETHDWDMLGTRQLAAAAPGLARMRENAYSGEGNGGAPIPGSDRNAAPAVAGDTMAALGKGPITANWVIDGLKRRNIPEHIAVGAAMNIQDESGFNPAAVGDNGNAYGLFQHNGDRKKALFEYARSRGHAAPTPDDQLDFFVEEMRGSEASAWGKISTTTDPRSAAAAILNHYERPAEQHRASREAAYLGRPGSVADFFPSQGNAVSPETMLGFADKNFDAYTTGENFRDENRVRDKSWADALLAEQAQAAAQELVYGPNSVIQAPDTAAGITPEILDRTQDPRVRQAAIALAADAPVDAMRQTPFDPLAPALPGSQEAATSLTQYAADQASEQSNNQALRIESNTVKVYGDGDPAAKLAERVGDGQWSDGYALSAINKVAERAGVSPAKAASYLEETKERGSWWNPFDNTIELDIDAATKLAKEMEAPENKRRNTLMGAQTQANLDAVANLDATMKEVEARIRYQQSRGQDTTELQQAYKELSQQALNIAKTRPVVTSSSRSREPEKTPAQAPRATGSVFDKSAEQLKKEAVGTTTGVERFEGGAATIEAVAQKRRAVIADEGRQVLMEVVGLSPDEAQNLDPGIVHVMLTRILNDLAINPRPIDERTIEKISRVKSQLDDLQGNY